MLAFTILLCHLVLLLSYLSFSRNTRQRAASAWIWGVLAGGLAAVHMRQIFLLRRKVNAKLGQSGGWFLARLMALSLPFIFIWVFLADNSDGNLAVQVSRHVGFLFTAFGTLVPVLSALIAGTSIVAGTEILDEDALQRPRADAHQAICQAIWALLVMISTFVLALMGKQNAIRWATPITLALVASIYFPLAAMMSRKELGLV